MRSSLLLPVALLLVCIGLYNQSLAHELQPSSLEIRQLTFERYELIWRAPIYYGNPHPAELQIPDTWQTIDEPTIRQLPDSHLHRCVFTVPGGEIDGSVVRFAGLEATITNVFVRISWLDGTRTTAMARSNRPWFEIQGQRTAWQVAGDYTVLGIDHILSGYDHLLFVLGLLLIVGSRWVLLKTITAFTIAHSITLAVATLGYASAPVPPLNAAIALSILFLGPEIVRVWRGQTSFTIRHPWVVAFAFGLLHGFGFASGLSTSGLPSAEIPVALLLFNVGVEIGQLFFVLIILLLERSFRVLEIRWPRWAYLAPGYTVGSLGAYWTIQRVMIMFGAMK